MRKTNALLQAKYNVSNLNIQTNNYTDLENTLMILQTVDYYKNQF